LVFENLDLPFDLAQGGESFDAAQDREPVERLVEPFRISIFGFRDSGKKYPCFPPKSLIFLGFVHGYDGCSKRSHLLPAPGAEPQQ
jgi:hypothetical protein